MRGSRNLYDMETRPQCYYDKEGEKEEIEAYRGVAVSQHLTRHGGCKAERKRKGITKGVYIYTWDVLVTDADSPNTECLLEK